jgi:hypothetical protein
MRSNDGSHLYPCITSSTSNQKKDQRSPYLTHGDFEVVLKP